MTSKDLEKYYPVLLKIADGADWEFLYKADKIWSHSGAASIKAAFNLLNQGYEIRIKEADPYADLKAAHADGKVIQVRVGIRWCDVHNPTFDGPPNEYRIKPDPVMVPLGPDDVSPNTLFRCVGGADLWRTVTGLGRDGVWIPHGTPEGNKFVTWEALQKYWEISYNGGQNWEKCEKEAVNP